MKLLPSFLPFDWEINAAPPEAFKLNFDGFSRGWHCLMSEQNELADFVLSFNIWSWTFIKLKVNLYHATLHSLKYKSSARLISENFAKCLNSKYFHSNLFLNQWIVLSKFGSQTAMNKKKHFEASMIEICTYWIPFSLHFIAFVVFLGGRSERMLVSNREAEDFPTDRFLIKSSVLVCLP